MKRIAALVATACAFGVAGCSPQSPAAPPSITDASVWVAESRIGGMCADGRECRTELLVARDGAWTLTSNRAASAGRLTGQQLGQLQDAVRTTALASAAPASVCARDSDGVEVRIRWRDTTAHEVSNCTTLISDADPLASALADLIT